MKKIKNNAFNQIVLVREGISVSTETPFGLEFTQLGGTGKRYTVITGVDTDCKTHTISFTLGADELPNGNYLVKWLDNNALEFMTFSANVSDFDSDSPLAYTVIDDSTLEDSFDL
mgnify:CR=1 FL=1